MSAKFIIIGLDGADSGMLDALSLNGGLPNLTALRKKGSAHKLVTPLGSTDDSIWASFQYAAELSEHGRYYYQTPFHDNYVGMSHEVEQLPTFWCDISDNDKRVAVLDIPKCTKPVAINGIHLVDWLTHGEYFPKPVSVPPSLAEEVFEKFGRPAAHQCSLIQHDKDEAEKAKITDKYINEIRMKCAAGLHYLNSEDWDLFIIGFREAHCCNHKFWHYAHSNSDSDNPVMNILNELDDAIGELVAAAGTSAEVIVFSPTNFASNGTLSEFMPEVVRRINNAVCLNHPEVFNGMQCTPNWPCLTLPYNENTLALRIRNYPKEKIFRNQSSNLPNPVMLDVIEKEFLALKGDEEDRPAVASITRPSSGNGACAKNLPDLMAHYRNGFFPKSLHSESIGVVQVNKKSWRKGNHTNGGFVFTSGAELEKLAGKINTLADIGKATKTIFSA